MLVFDIDGVLVDVTESYRETIQQTVAHFTGKRVTNELIQEYKNAGGWNNDWDLSHHLIAKEGVNVPMQEVVDRFNLLFFGTDHDGLVYRERWIAREGLLERLSETWEFALFTGRVREEIRVTIGRFAPRFRFNPIMSAEVVREQKPAPEGLLRIAEMNPGKSLWYIGDTVDDARSARAAGVPFIGIAAPTSPRRGELAGLFKAENAVAVLDDINQLETVLPE
jgi:HAD superfamily hydrolase (TIGR01548 family)